MSKDDGGWWDPLGWKWILFILVMAVVATAVIAMLIDVGIDIRW